MATPFTYLLVAITTVATVCSVAAAPVDARAGDLVAVAHAPRELIELVQWHSGIHSGITVASDTCVNPEWKSALSAIDPEDSMVFRVFHGADGIGNVAEDGFDFSPDSSIAPKGARKSARDPARVQDGSTQRAR